MQYTGKCNRSWVYRYLINIRIEHEFSNETYIVLDWNLYVNERWKRSSGLYYSLLNLKRYNLVHYWICPSILAIKAKAGLTLCLWSYVCWQETAHKVKICSINYKIWLSFFTASNYYSTSPFNINLRLRESATSYTRSF